MLTDALKSQIQTGYRRFLAARELTPRFGQKQMIAHIARVLGNISSDDEGKRLGEKHLCAIEAGTGTGKTMAYLLSAVPIARERNCKLVLSTATVALQEQLVNKDLPELCKLSEHDLRVVLAKGRGRYFCIANVERQLDNDQASGQMALYEDELEQRLDEDTLVLYRELLNRFASGSWDGDRDSLSSDLPDKKWWPVTSDHTRCTNRHCDHFSSCPFFKARDELDKANVVVANHDLVLADLSLGGGAILPEPERAIYVFDEAHHLADKAMGHFAYSLRLRSSLKWLRGSPRLFDQMIDDCDQHAVIVQHVERLEIPRREMEMALDQLLQLVRDLWQKQQPDRDRFRFPNGVVPESLQLPCASLAAAAEQWVAKAEQIVDLLKDALDGSVPEIQRDAAEAWYPRMGVLWSRAQAMYWLARSFARGDGEGSLPTARWINVLEGSEGSDFECRSSPISAAQTLQEHLWSSCYGAVLTSATMTALGQFSRIKSDLGLPDDTLCEQLSSPFDYANAASLVIPAMAIDPSDPDRHTNEVVKQLNQLLKEPMGSLVLFSSWRQMNTVIEALDSSLRERVLAQGDLSKLEIIRAHKARIDKGEPSVIFGLASFAEGVDLPGDYLTLVVITKLPFGVPDDPVDATLAEWIEQAGGNAFMQITVPAASMKLTQAVGRLLRTEKDTGRVVLLDRRVVSRRYGRQMLDALPPFRRQIEY